MPEPIRLKVNGKATVVNVPPTRSSPPICANTCASPARTSGAIPQAAAPAPCTSNGRAVKSCNVIVAQVQGLEVTTIEGITPADGSLHPMQAAFKTCHGLQCGFCTPGMVMSAIDLVTAWRACDRARDPRGTRGQSLPLHGLPEYRQGRRARCESHGALGSR